jgi:hypothetical protein
MDTRTLSAQTTSRKEECKKRLIKASLTQSKPNLRENVKRPASAEKAVSPKELWTLSFMKKAHFEEPGEHTPRD